jgi:hypothetical protein
MKNPLVAGTGYHQGPLNLYSPHNEEYCTPLDRRGGTNPPDEQRYPQDSSETEGKILAGEGGKDQRTPPPHR